MLGRIGPPGAPRFTASQHTRRACFTEHLLEHVSLETAVVVLAVEREELSETEIGGGFDASIELDERNSSPFRETASDRRLAGAAKAQQRHHR